MTLQIRNYDDRYVLWDQDEKGIPAVGQVVMSLTPAHALRLEVSNFEAGAGPSMGAKLSDISIMPNEYASAELIRSYGFSVLED